MSTFYTNLRDNTAARLIEQFGRKLALRVTTGDYSPSTGRATAVPTDYPTVGVEQTLSALLDGSSEAKQTRQEGKLNWDSSFILSAKDFAVADVKPVAGMHLVMLDEEGVALTNEVFYIDWVEPLQPSGIPVIYTVAVRKL